MNEFLNPKSMATPGAAGAMVMFVANSICFQFPEIEFRWAAIILSFLAGAIVFSSKELNLSHRAAFWALNSLIIFSVGVGTSNIAANVQQSTNGIKSANDSALLNLVFPAAHAEEVSASTKTVLVPGTVEAQLASITKQLERQTQIMLDLQAENKRLRAELSKYRNQAVQIKVEQPKLSNAAKIVAERKERQLQALNLEKQIIIAEKEQRQLEEARRNIRLEVRRLDDESAHFEQVQESVDAKATPASSPSGFFKTW